MPHLAAPWRVAVPAEGERRSTRPLHRRPRRWQALSQLESAHKELAAATADKGGHRVKAMELTRAAIAETKAGIDYDNRHWKDVASGDDPSDLPLIQGGPDHETAPIATGGSASDAAGADSREGLAVTSDVVCGTDAATPAPLAARVWLVFHLGGLPSRPGL